MRKKEQLSKKVDMLRKCLVFVRNQIRHLLAMVDVPSLRELEQRMSETLKKCEDYMFKSIFRKEILCFGRVSFLF